MSYDPNGDASAYEASIRYKANSVPQIRADLDKLTERVEQLTAIINRLLTNVEPE